jgi:hypothetical protein
MAAAVPRRLANSDCYILVIELAIGRKIGPDGFRIAGIEADEKADRA